MSRGPSEGSPSSSAPETPQDSSGRKKYLKNTVEIKDGLLIIAMTPFLRAKVATLRSAGDPVGGILEGFEDKELEARLGFKYDVFVFRIQGKCVEVSGERFRMWCRDLWEHLRPDVIGPARLELEQYLRNVQYADPVKVRTWAERLVDIERELSEADKIDVSKLVLGEVEAPRAEEVCLEGLFTLDDGKLAPLPSYAFKCTEKVIEMYNVKAWYDNLYIHINDRWLGEPNSLDVLRSVIERTYAKLKLHQFNWKYTNFRREVETILYDKAPRAEPVKAVKSCNWLIFWHDYDFEVKPYNGEFVAHDIMSCVNMDMLSKALKEGLTGRELAEREAPKLVKILQSWAASNWLGLAEIIGYTTIAYRYPLHKAFMLLGGGQEGKSTYLRMLKDILGSHNIASIPLQAFESLEYRFMLEGLVGKLANISADIPKKPLKHTGYFKQATGEDPMDIDRKFKPTLKGYVSYAKMVFAANQLPQTADRTHAFFRRWVIYEFPNRFQEDPGWYERNITRELRDQALTVGILAMRDVLRRGAFTGEADVRERWLEESDPIYKFIRTLERLNLARRDPNGRVNAKEFYDIYVSWAQNEGVEVIDKAMFTRQLKEYGITDIPIGGRQYYEGIRLLERVDTIKDKLVSGGAEGLEAYK
jgi:P4 family phage/plasmid primase-like protien